MPLQRSVSIFFAFSIAAIGVLLARAPNPQASQSTAAITQNPSPATPMILQEGSRSQSPASISHLGRVISRRSSRSGPNTDWFLQWLPKDRTSSGEAERPEALSSICLVTRVVRG